MISDDDDVCSLGICVLAALLNVALIDSICAGETGKKYCKNKVTNSNTESIVKLKVSVRFSVVSRYQKPR